MSENTETKMLPARKFDFTLQSGLTDSAISPPMTRPPFGGRAGRALTHEMGEKWYRAANMEQLVKRGIQSTVLVRLYANEATRQGAAAIVRGYQENEAPPELQEFLFEITQRDVSDLATDIRAIAASYPRILGDILR